MSQPEELKNATEVDLESAAAALLGALDSRPRPLFERATGTCRHCNGPKSLRRSLAEFCSDQCRTSFHNFDKKRGALVINTLIRWRRFRKKGDFTLLCRMVDEMIREDKASGRTYYPRPPAHVHAITVAGRRRPEPVQTQPTQEAA